MIKVSVPGKIHLLGEHSVVYGKPALLSTINLKIHLKLIPLKDNSKVDLEFEKEWLLNQAQARQVKKLQEVIEKEIKQKFSIKKIPNYKIEINSELPIGSGLGSSAALSVALTKALLKLLKTPETKRDIFEIALEGEKIFHGNPSGGDIAAVLNEGLTWYRKESEDVKIIQPLPFSIHKSINNFFLIDSGKPMESTGDMVELVNQHVILSEEKDIKIKYQKIFNEQEELVKQLATALKNGDEKLLMDCIKKGERNLEKLGVVGKKAKKIIQKVESLGGAAKILGGGGIKNGSGMILAFHKNPNTLLTSAKEYNWELIKINS